MSASGALIFARSPDANTAVLDLLLILVVNSGSCGEAEFEACQVAGSLPVQRGAGPVGL